MVAECPLASLLFFVADPDAGSHVGGDVRMTEDGAGGGGQDEFM
jgi:hypothetical protein